MSPQYERVMGRARGRVSNSRPASAPRPGARARDVRARARARGRARGDERAARRRARSSGEVRRAVEDADGRTVRRPWAGDARATVEEDGADDGDARARTDAMV